MPSTYQIAARTETQCEPCKYHKCVNAFYGADHSWRDYNCMHPKAFDGTETEPLNDAEKEQVRQRLIGRLLEDGRHIGKTEQIPSWCPLKRL